MPNVRQALREMLRTRGFDVGSDTLASRRELYVKSERDLSSGMFEFKQTVAEAIETMYQGRWTEGLPPRFAVLPTEAAEDPSFELLEQMRITPLLYEIVDGEVVFSGIAAVVERLRRQLNGGGLRHDSC